jgi:adenine-specific DNA-methyltransferase
MATGSSKADWKGKQLENVPALPFSPTLVYPGKRDEQAILATPPGTSQRVWGDASQSNRLYYGDNLPILAALATDPAVCGHVQLVYIDPPFATNSVFHSRSQQSAYSDVLTGTSYLEFLRERLILLRELLAPTGSIYVHLDENMAFYAKTIMDEIFGAKHFRNWITRKKCNPKNYTRKTYGNVSDYILFYTKSDNYVWNRPVEPWSDVTANKEYQYLDTTSGRRYKKVPVHAPGVRHGETGKAWRGKLPPPGKHWQYPPQTLDEMDARGEIYWSPTGNPRRKIYLDQSAGIPIQDIWLDCRDAHNQNIHVTGYPTEKNPDMLARIIGASSNPGDLVLDCFSGSGTTLTVADSLDRRWIGMDNSIEAITATLHRFAKGRAPMGDFVERPAAAPQQALFQKAFAWHDDDDPASRQNAPSHQAMTDFALYADEEMESDLQAIIQQWQDWQ